MEASSDAQIQIINYFEKALEAQPKWVQRLFEKEKVFFILCKDDHIGLRFTNKVSTEDRALISNYFRKYMEENPCEIAKNGSSEIIN